MTGDGIVDLVVSTRSAGLHAVFAGDGRGGFAPLGRIRLDADVIALAAADLDRDGRVDLAMVSSSHHSVITLRGDGRGGFAPFQPAPAARPS